jgi:hypothetical protein
MPESSEDLFEQESTLKDARGQRPDIVVAWPHVFVLFCPLSIIG